MQISGKISNLNKIFRLLISSIVIIFGFYIIINPIVKTISASKDSISDFFFGLLFFLILPSIIYCIIAMITKETEYVIVPALFLLITEYYFFHDFPTWISSDANATIALVIIPVYLLLALVFSYFISFIILKLRKPKKRSI